MITEKVIMTANMLSRRNAFSLANTLDTNCKGSSIYLELIGSDRQINAKSVLGILSAGYKKGDNIKVIVSGINSDVELSAINTLERWLEENVDPVSIE